jgi:hypothetical protein
LLLGFNARFGNSKRLGSLSKSSGDFGSSFLSFHTVLLLLLLLHTFNLRSCRLVSFIALAYP